MENRDVDGGGGDIVILHQNDNGSETVDGVETLTRTIGLNESPRAADGHNPTVCFPKVKMLINMLKDNASDT